MLPRERTKLLSLSLEEGKKYMENDTRKPTDFRSFVIQISKQAISDTLPGHSVSVSESPTRPSCSGQPLSPARGGMPPRQGTTSLSKAPCFSSTVTGTVRELLLLPARTRWRGWTCSGVHQLRFYSWASYSTYAFPHILTELVLQQQEGKETGK